MPVVVRNLRSGVVVFADPVTKHETKWAALGDENGEDVQMIPDELANNVELLKAVRKGVFEMLDPSNPAVQGAFLKQAGIGSSADAAAAEALAAIDRGEERSLVETTDVALGAESAEDYAARMARSV